MGMVRCQQITQQKTREKWNYSSGTTNILIRIPRHAIYADQRYWSSPLQALFRPLGMTTAVLESDNSGTLAGSSLAWASEGQWDRFGQLYLDQGSWNGKQLLPANWVQQARTASRGSKQAYGAHWWMSRRKSRPDLPTDSFSAEGCKGAIAAYGSIPARGDCASGTDTQKDRF